MHTGLKILITLVLAWFFILTLTQALAAFIPFPLQEWVDSEFGKNQATALSGLFFSHTIAAIICSVPVAFVVSKWFAEKALQVSMIIGILMVGYIIFTNGFNMERTQIQALVYLLDLIKFPLILVLLTWLFKRISSKSSGQL